MEMIQALHPIRTKAGDEYLVRINGISKQSLSGEMREALEGVELFEVSLDRKSGTNPTTASTLFEIARFIADVMSDNPDAIFYYYCDDLHDIPRRDTHVSPQAFRSRLFLRMFDRYVQKYQVTDIINTPVHFRIDHDIYIHFIAHARHHHAVQLLKQGILDMADK